jgi:DNA-binding CsgD family transcriptional regulator/tetratricopeptide (TPR) repeat protein
LLLDTVSLGLEGPLGRLSDGGRDLARILAIAGRPLTHADLAELSGLSPASLDSAIRDLRTEYLLDPRLPRSQLRLRHALVADVVAADLPHERRLELHAQVARWLAGSSLPSRDGEIAGHWQRADAPAEEITARSKAATAAHDLQAYAEEAEHRLRVVDLWNQVADPGQLTGTDRITAVVDADWALFDSGQGERDAALLTRELSNLPEAAVRDRAMLLRRLARVTAWIDAPKATELMLSAAALFEEAPGGLDHILMLADLTDLRRSQGRFDEAMRLADRALAACRDEPELGLERSVAARRALCLAFAGDADATATALHALSSATAATVREQVVAALRQTEALIRIGRPSEAHEAAADLLAAADRYGATGARLVNLLRSLVGRAELAAGRVDSARRLATSAARDAPAEDEGLLDLLSATLAIVDGDLIEAERLVTADVTTTTAWPADVLDAAKVLAEVHLWAGRPESAAEVLESVLDTVSGSDLASIAGPALVSLARAHADLAAARATTRRTEPVAVRTSMKIDPLTDAVSAAFWEAETARATDATSHAAWEHAADLAERSALRFDAAYACWRQAEALLHQHQRSEATASLRRAHQLAEAHQPLTAAIERTALAGRVDLTPERGQPGVVEQARPFGITDREMTVLTELAFGKSNPEIGASLYLSPKTVSVHISSLMRKLQARSRTEAVAVAQRAGLLS